MFWSYIKVWYPPPSLKYCPDVLGHSNEFQYKTELEWSPLVGWFRNISIPIVTDFHCPTFCLQWFSGLTRTCDILRIHFIPYKILSRFNSSKFFPGFPFRQWCKILYWCVDIRSCPLSRWYCSTPVCFSTRSCPDSLPYSVRSVSVGWSRRKWIKKWIWTRSHSESHPSCDSVNRTWDKYHTLDRGITLVIYIFDQVMVPSCVWGLVYRYI